MPIRRLLPALLATLLAACGGGAVVQPPALALSSSALAFSGAEAGADPAAQAVTASNAGAGALALPTAQVSYARGAGWLEVTVSGAQAPYTVTVQPRLAGLGPGTYGASVTIAAAGAADSPRVLAVGLTLTAAPRLSLAPTTLAFSGVAGGVDPAAKQVTASNAGGGTLAAPVPTVSYASGAGWLSVTVSGAQAPYGLAVQPFLTGLAAGTYQATVHLASPGAVGAASDVAVTLTVAPPAPPAMVLSTGAVEFRADAAGAGAAPQVVAIGGSNATPLQPPTAAVSYAGASTGWLTATVTGAAAPFQLRLEADATLVPLGLATATVTLTSANATNSPLAVPVTLWKGRVVEVRRVLTSWGEDGVALDEADPAVTAVALLQDDGAGGVSRVAAQQGTGLGAWLALAVPGPYRAEVTFASGARLYADASADLLDLGEDRGGRRDVAPATARTDVTLNLAGLEPWQSFDRLRLASWGAQSGFELDPGFGLGSQGDPVTLDWATTLHALLAPSDVLHVTQVRFNFSEPAQEINYLEVLAATSATGLSMASGTPLDVTPAAASPTTLASVPIDWRRGEMELAAGPFVASASGFAHRVGIYAIPAAVTLPSPLGGQPITVMEAVEAAGLGNAAPATATIGRWLPTSWVEYRETAFTTPVARRAPGASANLLGAQQRVLARDAMPASRAAGPLVGAVLSPTLDGLDALVPRTGVGLTPVLAWTAPAAPAGAVPTSYRVALQELTAAGTETTARLVGELVVPGPGLTLPPGLLAAGRAYAAVITARVGPGDAGGVTPLRVGVPCGEASLWTEVFTTAP